MIEAIVKAANLLPLHEPRDAFEMPMKKHSALIVGGTHLIALSSLIPRYAVDITIIIPSDIPELDREVEMNRAVQLEETASQSCRGIGFARDLSGVDNDALDVLIVSSIYPATRDNFLGGAWRVVKEFGKVIVFTNSEIPLTHLASLGIVLPQYYPVEGFYVGTMRKRMAIRSQN